MRFDNLGLNIDLKPVIVLTVVCVVSAISLGAFHGLTKERIEESEQNQVNLAFKEIFPSSEFEEVDNNVYRALSNGELKGYVGIAKGRGYGGFTGGFIKLAVGVNLEGAVKRVRVISQSETPGLGSRITENWFLSQFDGKTSEDIKLVKNDGDIEAITGATISSSAVVDAVRSEIKLLKTMIENNSAGV